MISVVDEVNSNSKETHMIDYNRTINSSEKNLTQDAAGRIRFESFEQLRTLFTDEEIVVMVARHLTNSQSSKESNAKRMAEERAMKNAVNEIAMAKFNKKYFSLEPGQQNEVLAALAAKRNA